MQNRVPETPVIDPGQPADTGREPGAQDRQDSAALSHPLIQIAIGLGGGLALVALLAGIWILANGNTRAQAYTARATIHDNAPEIASSLASRGMKKHGLSDEQAAPYAEAARTAELETGSCWRSEQSRYRLTMRCHITLHLETPARVSLDAYHYVEMERPQGRTWPFSKLPVLEHRPARGAAVETYNQDLTQ